MKDTTSCPYCQSEESGWSEAWGMSPEGWEEKREVHLKEHCAKCPTCGQILAEGYKVMAEEHSKLAELYFPLIEEVLPPW